jgi:hypothetical protein
MEPGLFFLVLASLQSGRRRLLCWRLYMLVLVSFLLFVFKKNLNFFFILLSLVYDLSNIHCNLAKLYKRRHVRVKEKLTSFFFLSFFSSHRHRTRTPPHNTHASLQPHPPSLGNRPPFPKHSRLLSHLQLHAHSLVNHRSHPLQLLCH